MIYIIKMIRKRYGYIYGMWEYVCQSTYKLFEGWQQAKISN